MAYILLFIISYVDQSFEYKLFINIQWDAFILNKLHFSFIYFVWEEHQRVQKVCGVDWVGITQQIYDYYQSIIDWRPGDHTKQYRKSSDLSPPTESASNANNHW